MAKRYVDKDMCKKCGGVCCKQNGCVYLPEDFKTMNINYLMEELNKGNISISGQPSPVLFLGDAWTYILYLRARNEDSPIVDLFGKGGPCINLTERGCSLKSDKRPSLGKSVKPTRIGGPCKQMHDPSDMTNAWLKYQALLKRMVAKTTNEEFKDILVKQIKDCMEIVRIKKLNNEELTQMEEQNEKWYYRFVVNKPYYDIEEVTELKKVK